jgi:hypothetical protein
LLYAAHDPQINHARVLQGALSGRGAKSKATRATPAKRTQAPAPPGQRATARG